MEGAVEDEGLGFPKPHGSDSAPCPFSEGLLLKEGWNGDRASLWLAVASLSLHPLVCRQGPWEAWQAVGHTPRNPMARRPCTGAHVGEGLARGSGPRSLCSPGIPEGQTATARVPAAGLMVMGLLDSRAMGRGPALTGSSRPCPADERSGVQASAVSPSGALAATAITGPLRFGAGSGHQTASSSPVAGPRLTPVRTKPSRRDLA